MKTIKMGIWAAAILVAEIIGTSTANGQAPATTPQTTKPATTDTSKPQDAVAPLTLDATPPPVNAEEDAAMKAYRDAPLSDVPKKLQMGEDFLQKYPQSRYRVEVYNWQVKGYLSTGQMDKMEVAGEKDLAIDPNDAQTLAILGSMLPRSMGGSMTEAQKTKVLADAEKYSQKALELVPTLPKPPALSDAQFISAKNQVSAMAYSGLGLVAFRRGKFGEAIPNLDQAVKLDPNPDPVNYFVLGICNEKASHFEDAIAAFNKCAAIPSSMQATCKTGSEEAKKLSGTQLSVPK
jgi:tetratricopeptide (TPR) repeat protein